MFAVAWLAALVPPVFATPFPQAPDAPAVLAIATDRVDLRVPCYALRCADREWRAPTVLTFARPGDDRPVVRSALPGAPGPGPTLAAPASRRDWVAGYSSDARVGARYGVEAIRQPDATLKVEVGTGYRMQPYVDDGVATTGAVARGKVEWRQQLAPRTLLVQQLKLEAGRGDTYVRNTVGVDVEVLPQWLLQSSLETRHDSAADGGRGRTENTGKVQLRYAF